MVIIHHIAGKKELIKMKREKKFFINGREGEVLLKDWETSDGCIATDRITIDGRIYVS